MIFNTILLIALYIYALYYCNKKYIFLYGNRLEKLLVGILFLPIIPIYLLLRIIAFILRKLKLIYISDKLFIFCLEITNVFSLFFIVKKIEKICKKNNYKISLLNMGFSLIEIILLHIYFETQETDNYPSLVEKLKNAINNNSISDIIAPLFNECVEEN